MDPTADTQRSRRDQEQLLFARYASERTPAARDAIVEQYMPMARKLARRYMHIESLDDLEQVAAIGLMNAVKRFDPGRGLAFSSFAFPTILGELRRYLRDLSWSVRPPRRIQEMVTRIDHETQTLLAELGRSPTVSEIAHQTGHTSEQVLEALQTRTARHALSLDQSRTDTGDPYRRYLDVAVDETGFAAAEDTVVLEDLLSALAPRERLILHLRFRQDLTQAEIGEIVGLSQMHVSRIIRAAVEQLQLKAEPGAPAQ